MVDIGYCVKLTLFIFSYLFKLSQWLNYIIYEQVNFMSVVYLTKYPLKTHERFCIQVVLVSQAFIR